MELYKEHTLARSTNDNKVSKLYPQVPLKDTPSYLEYMHITVKPTLVTLEFSPPALDTALTIHNLDPQPHPYTPSTQT